MDHHITYVILGNLRQESPSYKRVAEEVTRNRVMNGGVEGVRKEEGIDELLILKTPAMEAVPTCPDCRVKGKRAVLQPTQEKGDPKVCTEIYYCTLCSNILRKRDYSISSTITIL